MTVQQLKYFIETSTSGSISKAAERLYIAQPSLSNAMRELESEIGDALLSRTSKGTYLTQRGEEFLQDARHVIEQITLMEEKWLPRKSRYRLSIISQRYMFAVKAFANMIKKNGMSNYFCNLREGSLMEVIEEVRAVRSEIGILYVDISIRKTVERLLRENKLEFQTLLTANPCVLLRKTHPLAGRESVSLKDLASYPRISFEFSDYSALYISSAGDDIFKSEDEEQCIEVSDRGTMIGLLTMLDGYALATGLQGLDSYGDVLTAIPFQLEGESVLMEIGWIVRKDVPLSENAKLYLEELKLIAAEHV